MSAGALGVAHAAFHVLYPVDRLGLYFLAFTPLAVLTGAPALGSHSRAAMLYRSFVVVVASVVVASFVSQFNTRFFYVWRYDADTEHILSILDGRERGGKRLVRLGISWPLEPVVNFCRAVKEYTWLAPVDRRGPSGSYDYYIVTPPMTDIRVDDDALFRNRRLVILYQGRVSGTRLGAPAH